MIRSFSSFLATQPEQHATAIVYVPARPSHLGVLSVPNDGPRMLDSLDYAAQANNLVGYQLPLYQLVTI
jgi:hypothetical protein